MADYFLIRFLYAFCCSDATLTEYAVSEITACQRLFSRQKHCLSGHTDICMDKMSGQSFGKLKSKSIGN